MAWWSWELLGLGLVVVEVTTPGGLFAIFFGAGALVVGALVALGVAGPAGAQWLLFTALSVAALVILRRRLRRSMGAKAPSLRVDDLTGEIARAVDVLEPQAVGRAELRGTTWEARNVAATRAEAGQRCRVERVEGLMLFLHPL